MGHSKKVLIATIMVIIGTWIFNVYKFSQISLEEPVFLQHHIDSTEKTVDLFYIDNALNSARYDFLTIPKIKNEDSWLLEEDNSFLWPDYQWPYKVNKMTVDFSDVNASTGKTVDTLLENGPIHITEICISPYKGSAFNVDVGDIYLRKSDEVVDHFYESLNEEYSNQDFGHAKYRADREIEITGVQGGFLDYINGNYNININNKDILKEDTFPIKVEAGKIIDIYYGYNYRDISERLNNINKINLTLNVIDKDKNKDYINLQIGDGQPGFYNDSNVKSIVKKFKSREKR